MEKEERGTIHRKRQGSESETDREGRERHNTQDSFVCWLLNVPATCECISGTDLLRQFYVLPH